MAFSFKYSWVCDMKTGSFLANSRECVRVMGVLVDVGEVPPEDRLLLPTLMAMAVKDTDEEAISSMKMLTIDDGTDSVSFWAPKRMVDTPYPPKIGHTFDCILKLRQSASVKRWFADTLIEVQDPLDEQLRWMILSHQDQQRYSSTDVLTHQQQKQCTFSHNFGFPTRKRDATEVYRLIAVQQQQQQHLQQNENKYRRQRQKQHQHAVPLEGVKLEDLALVVQKPLCEMQQMVHELQLQGRIYQNQQGEYLPL
jgi:hypothetical protein